MKRFTTTMLATVFALAAGTLAAQDNPRPNHPQDRPPDTSQPSASQYAEGAGTFQGTISQIDQSGQTFTLRDASGKEVTISFDASTRVTGGDTSQSQSSSSSGSSMSGLKVGDEVVVSTTSKGSKNLATSVQVKPKKSSS